MNGSRAGLVISILEGDMRQMVGVVPDSNLGLCDRLPNQSSLRRGAVMVLLLIMLPVMIILAGLAINLAHIQLVQTELQIANDASARAANRVYTSTLSLERALAAAQAVADKNLVNAKPLRIQRSDIVLGTSLRTRYDERYNFQPARNNINALQLHAEKTQGSASGPVQLLFPNLGGRQTVDLTSVAISTQVELDIALVIDRSGSMAYAADEKAVYPPLPKAAPLGWFFGDPAPPNSRWLDTVAAVKVFLNELERSPQRERVALTTYADSAKRDVDLTENYSAIMNALDVYSRAFHSGGTNIGGGMRNANNNLASSRQARPWATKVIILMTDGIHNTGTNPVTEAERIAKTGVMIFTVTFANEADQARMKRVAELGGGTHYHARTASDLQAVFREIAKKMPTLLTK